MSKKTAFSMIMIDERYPQKLQHVYIDQFLKKNGYLRSFYGAETELTKNNHHILIHHLKNKIPGETIVFFSIEQFRDSENKINFNLMRQILKSGYDLLIALQEICLLSKEDSKFTSILMNDYSIRSRSLVKSYKENLK